MTQLPVVTEPASCDDCGLCCQGIGSPVLIYQSRPRSAGRHPARPADLPQNLIDEIDEHFLGLARGEEPQEQCLWYDAARKQCRHYEFRPPICRDYERGGRDCLNLRTVLHLHTSDRQTAQTQATPCDD
ncbi:MAG: YkgJ family cysteine cluster protein [Planctomycetota bacterium]|nr:MAG: YkgJ family cysteine cluster protein [Planctomycetota bacterium]REJ90103.1 MAG: YkgJ family cysteine cluster protein [Planctomycetota bacterium]REK21055.1 MAG: YkgJ family cysteine cluster protein [Planctomycetota bacterium]REK38872.1 MAG: YkgJ family cysteine cluster protein [Planctomycetota bacterium]